MRDEKPLPKPGMAHHWIPKRDGSWNGEPSYRQVCQYCGTAYNPDLQYEECAETPWKEREQKSA